MESEEILIRLGLGGASKATKRQAIERFLEVLQLRIGFRLASLMPADQLHNMPDPATDPQAFERATSAALSSSVPDYQHLVRDEIERVYTDFEALYNEVGRK